MSGRALALFCLLLSSTAQAKDAPEPPAPYSTPWQLRSVLPVSSIRNDTAVDFFNDGRFAASIFFGGYAVTDRLVVYLRLASAGGELPGGPTGAVFGNPTFGANYILPLPRAFRLMFTLALAFPGMFASSDEVTLGRAAQTARLQMDNAMFSMNNDVILIGVAAAWVRWGVTIQIEGTVLQNLRQQGSSDVANTNFTCGFHVGYFFFKYLSIGTELRYQRWLTTPSFIVGDPSARDQLSLVAGLRGHIPIGKHWLRPGIAYARGLDDPMASTNHNILMLDLPFIF